MAETRTLDIAKKLFMKFGVRSVTMDDISKEAGISKKTIYSYVNNKAQLIDCVVDRYISAEQCAIEEIRASSEDALDEMIKISEHIIFFLRQFIPSLTYDLKKYYKISWDKVENVHFEFVRATILENIQRGKAEGVYREDLNEEIISKLYLASSRQMVNEEFFPMRQFPKVELFEHFISYHLYGILNEKGLKKYKSYKANVK